MKAKRLPCQLAPLSFIEPLDSRTSAGQLAIQCEAEAVGSWPGFDGRRERARPSGGGIGACFRTACQAIQPGQWIVAAAGSSRSRTLAPRAAIAKLHRMA